ncbi:MAG: Mur ligase domain-containing protein [Puniceicoccales bacterium]|jgi:UDP-N-acetylmuramate: L-alanyl-gamma-D-glutamyl-meso-diaminopimelate ligase|nr:Mur ligase domain-containing protein [Puniceicoccales bacterium]
MKIYFLGIGGTAMGNLAILMQARGHDVCGSDAKIYPPMSHLLAKNRIAIYEGYSAQRLEKFAPELAVVGNAIGRGNGEIEWLLDQKKIPYCSLPELVRRKIIGNRDAIVVAGTHGKTTTTTLISYLLALNRCDPGYFIGGAPLNFPSGASYGAAAAPFVIEGDEYDSAFFDKRSKFIHYSPKILAINNIEPDHLDIFRDLEDIQRTFSHAIRLVPASGCVIANGDSEAIRAILPVAWTRTIFVGKNSANDFTIGDEQFTPQGTTFTLGHNAEKIVIQSPLFGEHNVWNVAMAVVTARQYFGKNLNIDLQNFRGIGKRQEIIFCDQNTAIIEDFAHHPTAISATIRATKQKFPHHRLITAFEPRSNTACSDCFQEAFIEAFRGSDEVYIAEIFKKRPHCLDTHRLARDIHYCPAHFTDTTAMKEIFPAKIGSQRQVFLFLSNGDFSNVAQHLRETIADNRE